jgi:bacterial/archaeal transporter family protein
VQTDRMNWLLWSLLSAFFAGLTAILAKVGVAGVDSNIATAVRTTVVLVFAWGVVLATTPLNALSALASRTWLFLTLSGLATGLSWLCYFRALQLGEASKVAPIDKLSVVFVLVFAAVFLGEQLALKTVVGGTLITAGAVVLALK